MSFVETLKRNFFLLIGTFLLIYIIFNFLDGERGLFSFLEKKENYTYKKSGTDLDSHTIRRKNEGWEVIRSR